MKTCIITLFIVLLSFVTGCKKEDTVYMTDLLMGAWIRNDLHSDTMIFGGTSNDNWFELRRGFTKIDGYNIPISPSGLYVFNLKKDSIQIQNLLSSSMAYETYYFKINGDSMDIGNFIGRDKTILHFSKKL